MLDEHRQAQALARAHAGALAKTLGPDYRKMAIRVVGVAICGA
jgi:hypothetical protein